MQKSNIIVYIFSLSIPLFFSLSFFLSLLFSLYPSQFLSICFSLSLFLSVSLCLSLCLYVFQVCEGDTIEVTVHNELANSEGTSVHWHGLLQRGTPHMDGVSLVTQCPITARSSFVYR